jgi:hypothetical protein
VDAGARPHVADPSGVIDRVRNQQRAAQPSALRSPLLRMECDSGDHVRPRTSNEGPRRFSIDLALR